MSAPGIFRLPEPVNEPVHSYEPGSPERAELKAKLDELQSERIDLPLVIGGEEIRTGHDGEVVMPHRSSHVLADMHQGGPDEVDKAIKAAGEAWHDWSRTPWEERAAVLLRAAELLAGPWRMTLNAATMLGQSKTAHQAEIDAACELIDFWRFNPTFMRRIYEEQPISSPGQWNRMEYRPLEGFVFAVSPFNFTAIGGNLPTSAALMGNTVVWKPATTAAYSAHFLMQLLQEAGLPAGVINLVYGPGARIGDAALASPDLAGIHFTGSTGVFQVDVADGREQHRALPELPSHRRRDGRQGLHPRPPQRRRRRGRDRDRPRLVRVPGPEVLCGLARLRPAEPVAGAEASAWPRTSARSRWATSRLREFHGRRHRRQLVPHAEGGDRGGEGRPDSDVLVGGEVADDEGFFVSPTVIETRDPEFRLLRDELFGPVVTAYVYPDDDWQDTLEVVDRGARRSA